MFLAKPDTEYDSVPVDKTRSPPLAPCIIIAPMLWISPSQKDTAIVALEKRLWGAAEQAVPAPNDAESEFVIRHCPDPHDATGRFGFVLANPSFNVNAVAHLHRGAGTNSGHE
jgi:hypothetical protein